VNCELLLATENKGKIAELLDLLDKLGFEDGSRLTVLTPQDVRLSLRVVENGRTYAENAALKAVAYAKASGRVALGDDSGLEVDALGGQPGLYSHRFASLADATDADRRRYLLDRLAGLPRPWTAAFHCTVAIATPQEEVFFAEGTCSGEIIPEERGSTGFGYDPIFLVEGMGRTMAELGMAEKNRLSHRARAVLAAKPILRKVLGFEDRGK